MYKILSKKPINPTCLKEMEGVGFEISIHSNKKN